MATEELVERLRAGDKFAKAEDCRHDRCNCAIMDEAADTISRLVGERDELRGQTYLASAEAAEFHRDNAIKMWDDERKKRTAAEARVAQLESLISDTVKGVQQVIDTQRFNAKHMIAEDSLRDAWQMLESAKQQFDTDADHLQHAVDAARTALSQSPDRESGT